MIKRITSILFVVALPLVATVPHRAESDKAVPYPAGYRHWIHVSTTIVGPQSPFFKGSGGIHHIYANEKALRGYESGKFPDGATLVFDLLDTKQAEGLVLEGPRQRVDVMVKDSQKFSATGGWGFERFAGDSQTERLLTEERQAQCFSCHQKSKAQDFVFSKFRK